MRSLLTRQEEVVLQKSPQTMQALEKGQRKAEILDMSSNRKERTDLEMQDATHKYNQLGEEFVSSPSRAMSA